MSSRVLLVIAAISLVGSGEALATKQGPSSRTGFIENIGQWDAELLFAGGFSGTKVLSRKDSVVLKRSSRDGTSAHVVQLLFEGVDRSPAGQRRLPGKHHYLRGRDSAAWHRDARAFERVHYPISTGGDLALDLDREGLGLSIHGTLADISSFRLRVLGSIGVHDELDGSLSVLTTVGSIRLSPPQLVHEDGRTDPLTYSRSARGSISLRAGSANHLVSTVDQPALAPEDGLAFSTYHGGTGADQIQGAATRADGSILLIGETESVDLPVTLGAYSEELDPNRDAWVAQYTPQGELVFSTYLGGTDDNADFGGAIQVRDTGEVVVAGYTNSNDFPVTAAAIQQTKSGLKDWFITTLSQDGSDIVWSTLLGGGVFIAVEVPYAMALLPGGDIVVCGQGSRTFPTTTGAFQTSVDETQLSHFAVVARLNSAGTQLIYSTFINGTSSQSVARDLAIGEDESVYAIGRFSGTGFPSTPGAIQGISSVGNPTNPFLVRLAPDGSELEFAGSLGGSSVETLYAVDVDAQGNAVVAGSTSSDDLPTTEDAVFPTGASGFAAPDIFLTVVDPSGSKVEYMTYLPAGDLDAPYDVAVDGSGAIVVSGATTSNSFPTTAGAVQEESSSPFEDVDLFVTRLSPDRLSLEYSTRLGGAGDEGLGPPGPCALALAPDGDVVIAGESYGTDYPTTPGAFQSTNMGIRDAVITRLTMLPSGVSRYGASSPGCRGELVISVTAMPQVGAQDFAVTCTKAPPYSGGGLLAVSLATLDTPLPLLGADVWVDPAQVIRLLPLRSNAIGYAEHTLPIAAELGQPLALQAFWPDACAPGGWSASAGLTVDVQP